jgi:hypothetical protein
MVCETIDHGMKIVPYGSGGESRNLRTFYSRAQADDDFDIGVVFDDFEEAEGFSSWLKDYCRELAKPVISVGPMRVWVPTRDFLKLGVPMGGIEFGAKGGQHTWRFKITFKGTQNPIYPGGASVVDRGGTDIGRYLYRWFYPFSSRLDQGDTTNDVFSQDTPLEPPPGPPPGGVDPNRNL